MSNKPRLCQPNLTYYLESRCIECRDIMKDPGVKDMLIKVISMAQKKYTFEVVFFTIINTHFHFIFRTVEDGESISRIMQFIKSQIAMKYNRKMNRTGPFWNERFKDEIIEHTDNPSFYLLWLIWYLAYLVVMNGHSSEPRNYLYSSINAYLDYHYVSPVKITLHSYFIRLGDTFEECVKKFLSFEELYLKRLYFGF